jgi:hypothetical protein
MSQLGVFAGVIYHRLLLVWERLVRRNWGSCSVRLVPAPCLRFEPAIIASASDPECGQSLLRRPVASSFRMLYLLVHSFLQFSGQLTVIL